MRIMLTGAGGFLGNRLFSYYREKYEVWAPSHKELDFTREDERCSPVPVYGRHKLLAEDRPVEAYMRLSETRWRNLEQRGWSKSWKEAMACGICA